MARKMCFWIITINLLGTLQRTGGISGDYGWSLRDYPEYYYEEDYYEEQEVCTFEESHGFALYGHNQVTIPGTSIDECKQACSEATTFDCRSFDYNKVTKSCFLSSSNKDSPYYGQHKNSIHFEKQCEMVYGQAAEEDEVKILTGTTVFKDGHCFVQYGPVGHESKIRYFPVGTESDYVTSLHGNITRLIVTSNYGYVQSIQLYYGDIPGNQFYERQENIVKSDTTFSKDEYIQSISGQFEYYFSAVTFTTNKQVLGPFGPSNGGLGNFSVNGKGKALSHIVGANNLYTSDVPGLLTFYFFC